MSSSAEEANCDDGDILVPSSQQLRLSVDAYRPSKRRRLERDDESASDDSSQAESYDLPLQVNPEEDKFNNIKSKYDSYLHVPVHVDTHHDEFLTQADHPGSSPSAMRGPRWRKKTPPVLELIDQNVVLPSAATDGKSCARPFGEFDDIDVDDAELLEALAASQEHATTDTSADDLNSRSASDSRQKTLRQTTLFGMNTTQRTRPQGSQARKPNWPAANRIEPPTHHQLDKAAMETWVYPLNVGRIRDYQFNIVHRALYHNILVALPTGLGKTFIAATVMLNFFRWTKMAQIVFVAPTKPLVTQQVDACFHITGIPRSQTTLLTGEVSPAIRAEEWQEKRVFFMTPQTLVNDLKNGMADPKRIVLLVVDEAHKATGNYAYVEVVRFLRRFNSSFRVLALTATPGSTVEAVQKVVDGLGIARVEIRTEESMDIRSFVHTRKTELKIFDNSDEVENCLELFSAAVKPVLNKVASLNVYFSSDPRTMTLYGLMKGRERWAQSEAGRKANWGLKGTINACFKPLMSLAHNVELLKFHGIGPFYHKMKAFEDDTSVSKGKYAKQIVESESFRKLMSRTRGWINSDDFVGHPKLSYLNEVVLNHFLDAGHGVADGANESAPSNTRIMIFAHYRDSAEEINRVLNRHQPMIRAHVFVGQQGTKGSAGMDQKTQIDIIKKFKAGTYNTLVATSIGEEGLDIGEVDLIVCYDCSKSPIRMLQRMGRTGRKRAGQIVLLLMRGKEERDYFTAKDNYLKMQEIIEQGTEFAFHEEDSPRIVPREIQPVADKRLVEIPIENTQLGDLDPRKRKPRHAKRPPKRFNMPDGVDTGFAFLGGGKGKKAKTANNPPQPITDLVDAELPDLDSVVLTTEQETDLDRRYAQVAGDGMVYIERIRFDTHPGQMRQLCKTQLVRHSVTTTALVQASKVMLTHNRNWQRPAQPAQIPEVSQGLVEEQSQKPSRQSLATHKRTRTTLQKSTRNTKSYVDSDEYDSNDSFVDNRPLPQPDLTSSLEPFDSSAPIQRGVDENNNEERPFYVSQKDNLVLDSDEDDLPDVSSMIARQRSPGSSGGPSRTSSSVPKRPLQPSIRARKNGVRRVIDDSESDEDN